VSTIHYSIQIVSEDYFVPTLIVDRGTPLPKIVSFSYLRNWKTIRQQNLQLTRLAKVSSSVTFAR